MSEAVSASVPVSAPVSAACIYCNLYPIALQCKSGSCCLHIQINRLGILKITKGLQVKICMGSAALKQGLGKVFLASLELPKLAHSLHNGFDVCRAICGQNPSRCHSGKTLGFEPTTQSSTAPPQTTASPDGLARIRWWSEQKLRAPEES